MPFIFWTHFHINFIFSALSLENPVATRKLTSHSARWDKTLFYLDTCDTRPLQTCDSTKTGVDLYYDDINQLAIFYIVTIILIRRTALHAPLKPGVLSAWRRRSSLTLTRREWNAFHFEAKTDTIYF